MFNNGLLVMDAFADEGFLVLGLDYFRGDPVWKHRKNRHDTTTEPDFDYDAWKDKHVAFADVAVPKWVAAVKKEYDSAGRKYACVGYVSMSITASVWHLTFSAGTASARHTCATCSQETTQQPGLSPILLTYWRITSGD